MNFLGGDVDSEPALYTHFEVIEIVVNNGIEGFPLNYA